MANFEVLLTNVLAADMQAKRYDKIRDMLLKDHSFFRALVDAATQEEVIAFLDHYAPQEAGEVLDGDLEYICSKLLPIACNEKGWYALCGHIFGMGYYSVTDPLCGSRHPLAFAAANQDSFFSFNYLRGQRRFDSLNFDEMRRCEDGVYRTLLEEIVLTNDVCTMKFCLENGANANAFGFRGDKLQDIARSSQMRRLLRKYGGKRATRQERYLVRAVHELRQDCLKQDTVDNLLGNRPLLRFLQRLGIYTRKPLLRISWFNGSTSSSREQTADIYYEAALACCPELLKALYPFARKAFDDEARCKDILLAILGQGPTLLPFGRILNDRPENLAKCLEVLSQGGFQYGVNADPATEHPIVQMFSCACWTFFLKEHTPSDIQLRVFRALWEIGGSPTDPTVLRALEELALEHPLTGLQVFLLSLKDAH